MNKINDNQLLNVEKLIESLICSSCTDTKEEKDCSSCEIYNQLKVNLLKNIKI